MVAQKGRDLLLKVDSDGGGTFTTIAGMRTQGLSLNSQTVDVTDADSVGEWRQLLAGSGEKSARLSGSGIFKDAASDETVRGYFFNSTIRDWQVIIPSFGTVEGAFQITALEFTGRYDGEVAFELSLESAGALSFAAG